MSDWFRYDDIADCYASIAEPAYFAKAAEDLVAMLHPTASERLLDAGTGTGAIASAAMRAGARVFASDLSVAMLDVARSRGVRGAAANLMRLPFADRTFDAITLGFVLSHVVHPVDALREIQRVLSDEGRVALSAWKSTAGSSPAGMFWRRIAEEFVSAAELDAAATGVPGEHLLATPERLRETLETAGFRSIAIESRAYPIAIGVDEFLRTRLLNAGARWMQIQMSADRWEAFTAEAARRLNDQFGSELRFDVVANFAVASDVI